MVDSTEKSKDHRAVITPNQVKDSGMALVLICLILWFSLKNEFMVIAAVVFLLADMTVPTLFKSFARFWFGLSRIIGANMSKIILSILFFTVVTPVGLVRRLLGKDDLQLGSFKKTTSSVFIRRDHGYTGTDLQNPF
jgi:hypothetical protein